MPTATQILGQRIKEYRYQRDWTQEQMALHCGVGRHTIQRAECGIQLAERTEYKLKKILEA
jgi:transcriptional regulator with XRE-family HTH domain